MWNNMMYRNWWMPGGFFPFAIYWPVILILVAIEFILKGMALYRSARNGQTYWFVALLVINTLGILPLIYLIWFSKQEAPVKVQAPPSRRPRRRKSK